MAWQIVRAAVLQQKLAQNNGIDPSCGQSLRLRIDELLAGDAPPRLLVDMAGRVLAFNAKAEVLARAFSNTDSEPAKMLRQWIAEDCQAELSLNLEESGVERRYDLTALNVNLENGRDAVLLLPREPQIATHLVPALTASRQLFKDLVGCAQAFAWETDSTGSFTYVSGAQILGFSSAELMGQAAATALALDRATAAAVFSAVDPVEQADLWCAHRDGRRICLQASCRPVFDPNGTWRGSRGMAMDVTAEREQEEALADAHKRLDALARTDPLTGLFNRRAFDETMITRINHNRRMKRRGALLYVDLDHFKAVNDKLGHAAGDAVLARFGELVRHRLRAGDVAARLGGDEFAIWLEETEEAGATIMAEWLLTIAGELKRACSGEDQALSLSIGVALSDPGEVLAQLLERADMALYAAKARGRNAFALAGRAVVEDAGNA